MKPKIVYSKFKLSILVIILCNTMNAQKLNYLIEDLENQKLLNEKIDIQYNDSLPFTTMYLSETKSRESLRYQKRRRYYTGVELTERAKKIIETISKHQILEDSVKYKMLNLLNKPEDSNIEYLIDNISVWQYLSEMELYNSSQTEIKLNKYLQELRDYDIIDSILISRNSSYKDIVSHFKNEVILDIKNNLDFAKIVETLNSKETIRKLQLTDNSYQMIKPIDISRIDKINGILKDYEIEHRILTISDQSDLTWIGLISLTKSQYEMFKEWDKGYEYPFYSVEWFVTKLQQEPEFE